MLKRFRRWASRKTVAHDASLDRQARRSTWSSDTNSDGDDRTRHANSIQVPGIRCIPGVTITETVKFELPIEPALSTPKSQRILHRISEEDCDSSIHKKEYVDSGKELSTIQSERGDGSRPSSPIEGPDVRSDDCQQPLDEPADGIQEASLSHVTSTEDFRTPIAEFADVDVDFGTGSTVTGKLVRDAQNDDDGSRAREVVEPLSVLTTPIHRKSFSIQTRNDSRVISPPTPSSSSSSFVVGEESRDHHESEHDHNDEHGPPMPPTSIFSPQSPSSMSACVTNGTWLIPIPILIMPSPSSFEYQFGGLLGEGGFGKVMLALHLITHTQYAMKLIQLKRIRGYREALSVANEIKVLQTIHRAGGLEMPFLARPAPIKDWIWQLNGHAHIVMEYCQGGDLGHDLDRHSELRDPIRFKLLAAELVLALLALHDRNIVHHDVKPANVLIDAAGHVALTDFGGAHVHSQRTRFPFLRTARSNANVALKAKDGSDEDSDIDESSNDDMTPIFTLRYVAPEVLGSSFSRYGQGPTSDFWSLGVSLFELATGQDLIDEIDDNEAMSRIQRGDIDLDQLILLSSHPGLRQFVSALLVLDPSERLSGHSIKTHSYFVDYTQSDWNDIASRNRPPFSANKLSPVDPTDTTYDVVLRAGEEYLRDADPEIVCRWLEADGIRLPHHRASASYRRHKQNARLGFPGQTMQYQKMREDWWHIKQPVKKAEEQPKSMWWPSN